MCAVHEPAGMECRINVFMQMLGSEVTSAATSDKNGNRKQVLLFLVWRV